MAQNDNELEGHVLETYRSLMLYGSTGLKFVLTVNGGAAIAVLTFLGHLVSRGGVAPDLRGPLSMFLIGVITGGLATLTTYLTQLTLFNEAVGRTLPKWQRTHVFWL